MSGNKKCLILTGVLVFLVLISSIAVIGWFFLSGSEKCTGDECDIDLLNVECEGIICDYLKVKCDGVNFNKECPAPLPGPLRKKPVYSQLKKTSKSLEFGFGDWPELSEEINEWAVAAEDYEARVTTIGVQKDDEGALIDI